jgi:hypothetical protein
VPLVAKRKCTTELDHQRQMDSNFGSCGRAVDRLTGGERASAKRKAKRMTYPVRIPAGLVHRLLHPTTCLQFDGTGSVSNSDYDRAETNPVWNRAEPEPNKISSASSDAEKVVIDYCIISMTRLRCITLAAT